ncbi:PCRF domain-containing protein, partial [bacterium]|nr:PCRF domain-containing protein [bacterium]
MLQVSDLWLDPDKAKTLQQEKNLLDEQMRPFRHLKQSLDDLQALVDLIDDQADSELAQEADLLMNGVKQLIADIEFKKMFTHQFDSGNAFIEIQSGSGGTEAQDWADMLWRMYRRWCEKKGFEVELLDYSPGDVAGIKGVTFKITGSYAYGLLRTETG